MLSSVKCNTAASFQAILETNTMLQFEKRTLINDAYNSPDYFHIRQLFMISVVLRGPPAGHSLSSFLLILSSCPISALLTVGLI